LDPKVGIIGFAFSLREEESNPSNIALAVYAAKMLIPGAKHGHDGMQNATD